MKKWTLDFFFPKGMEEPRKSNPCITESLMRLFLHVNNKSIEIGL